MDVGARHVCSLAGALTTRVLAECGFASRHACEPRRSRTITTTADTTTPHSFPHTHTHARPAPPPPRSHLVQDFAGLSGGAAAAAGLPLRRRSYLGHVLPESLLYVLVAGGPDAFAAALCGEAAAGWLVVGGWWVGGW